MLEARVRTQDMFLYNLICVQESYYGSFLITYAIQMYYFLAVILDYCHTRLF